PFRLRDSSRIGFIGLLFSQVIPGAVSGDVVKVVMLAREQERRTAAAATVVMDRIVGLFALALLAGIASLLSWPELRGIPALGELVIWVAVLVGAGAAGFGLLFTPIMTHDKWTSWLAKAPVVGGAIRELLDAIAIYRGRFRVVLAAVVLGVLG